MALNISYHKKLEHHRNPSGLHNKVNWLLQESRYNAEVLDYLASCITGTVSWEKAFWIANRIVERNFTLIKERYPQDWYWARKFVNLEREYQLHKKGVIK